MRSVMALLVHIVMVLSVYAHSESYSIETTASTVGFMFNLTSDPHENRNVITNSSYEELVEYFSERSAYWKNYIGTTYSPNMDNYETWYAAGGLVAWTTSDYEPIEVEQIYNYDSAPHIVFVLVDDWGYNDVGFRSTYLSWTTPTFDRLASEGIVLDNYYTNYLCTPSRGSFMTGRYALRLGMSGNNEELALNETTLAQEMKSAGYRTYLVGKWHLGFSTYKHYPTNRGFDYYYGYLSGEENYYNKTSQYKDVVDLTENLELVTDETELSSDYHNGYLFAAKAQKVIEEHAANYPSTPMFFYYAMQLIHSDWIAPDTYKDRCGYPTDLASKYNASADDLWNYCALNVMLDEAITNLTCILESNGFADNTILIISGDNGGNADMSGNSYPFRGYKSTVYRGGVSNTAIVHSKLLPESSRGTYYTGQVHITDWLPTLMGRATNGEWTGSYAGDEVTIDGKDVWDAFTTGSESPHEEIVFYRHGMNQFAAQYNNIKYMVGFTEYPVYEVMYNFTSDIHPDYADSVCDSPSLILYDDSKQAQLIAQSSTYFKSLPSFDHFLYLSCFIGFFVFVFGVVVMCSTVVKSHKKSLEYQLSYMSGDEDGLPILDGSSPMDYNTLPQ